MSEQNLREALDQLIMDMRFIEKALANDKSKQYRELSGVCASFANRAERTLPPQQHGYRLREDGIELTRSQVIAAERNAVNDAVNEE